MHYTGTFGKVQLRNIQHKMHFYKDNLNFFFVHIPRTGGRYVKELLLSNQFKSDFNCPGKVFYKNIEIMHLHESLLNDFNMYKKSKKFSVVRNPLSRFISATSIDLSYNRYFDWKLNTVDNVLDYITFQKKVLVLKIIGLDLNMNI